eukprot:3799575-Rhodomonas_salina.1
MHERVVRKEAEGAGSGRYIGPRLLSVEGWNRAVQHARKEACTKRADPQRQWHVPGQLRCV